MRLGRGTWAGPSTVAHAAGGPGGAAIDCALCYSTQPLAGVLLTERSRSMPSLRKNELLQWSCARS